MALPETPLTRGEQYLNAIATGGGTIPDEPLTRAEQYLNKIATGSGNTPDEPLTRMEQYLGYIAENGGGGGGGVLMVTDNDGTLDKTMGEIQDAFLAGRRILIYADSMYSSVVSVAPPILEKQSYSGFIHTLVWSGLKEYVAFGDTEEAARNAYPAFE